MAIVVTKPLLPTLAGLTPADWSILANLATILGVAVAVLAGLIALRTYRSSNRNADNAHMHALFRDYQRIRFDHELACSQGSDGEGLSDVAASIKLYVLEEMWVWVAAQRRRYHDWFGVRDLKRVRWRRQSLNAWCATINSHIKIDQAEVLENLEANSDCYSPGFLQYLAANFEDPRFKALQAIKPKPEIRGDT